jgi:hypothetical protein
MFQVAELSFELIEELRPLVSRIRARDRGLADQLMRAASSVALNIEEGRGSDPAISVRVSSRRLQARRKRGRRCALRWAGATSRRLTRKSRAKCSTASPPCCGSSRTGRLVY